MSRCLECAKAIGEKSTRCKSCAARNKYRDPAARQKMREAKLASLAADPAQLAVLRQNGLIGLRKVHERNRNDPMFGERQRERALRGIPRERWSEYRRYRRMLGAAEARRIIDADLRADVRRAERAMLAKQQADQAQAY